MLMHNPVLSRHECCLCTQIAACTWLCSVCRRWQLVACTTMLVRDVLLLVAQLHAVWRCAFEQLQPHTPVVCLFAGGGFHRYSVDEFWHIPHFEKVVQTQFLTTAHGDSSSLCSHLPRCIMLSASMRWQPLCATDDV